MERDVEAMKQVTAQVAVIEERTKNTDENVKAIRSGMGSLTQVLMEKAFEELRTYRPRDG